MKRLVLPVGGLALGSFLLLLGYASAQQAPTPKQVPGQPPPKVDPKHGPAGGPGTPLPGGFLGLPQGGQVPPGGFGGISGFGSGFGGASGMFGQSLPAGGPAAGPAPEVKDAGPFTSKEGKKGWKVVIPGNRPLATPAVADGKILIGGGFGSHEFYAFDAKTGKKLWLHRTGDDGPTAAVVEDGLIAFNTESCELEIITMQGKQLWKKWLGDPLMSMPAISQGKVYMAYPDSKGDHRHHLACFDLKTGKQEWTKPIPAEIITAPVIADHKIYVATVEGTVTCFHEQDGKVAWAQKKNATSSPMVWNGHCFFSRREAVQTTTKDGKKVTQQTEMLAAQRLAPAAGPAIGGQPGTGVGGGGIAGFGGGLGGGGYDFKSTARTADYLDAAKRKAESRAEQKNKLADAGVGFATAPAAAGLPLAEMNLGQLSVSGVWSFQGSRPFAYRGKLYSAMGDGIQCLDPKTDKVLWKKDLHDAKGKLVDAAVTPPALVNGKIFLGTVGGEVLCLSAADGKLLWKATVGEPIVFQPALAGGRVYVSTSTGSLYCLETGDEADDGWRMWGGTAAHNGLVKE
jgi:Ca-activated chloride channel family protein